MIRKLLLGCCEQDLTPFLRAINKSRSEIGTMGSIKQDSTEITNGVGQGSMLHVFSRGTMFGSEDWQFFLDLSLQEYACSSGAFQFQFPFSPHPIDHQLKFFRG